MAEHVPNVITESKVNEPPISRIIMERVQEHIDYGGQFVRNARRNDRMYRALGEERRAAEPGRPRANTGSLEYHRNVESVTSAVDAVHWGDDPWFMPWSNESRSDVIEASQSTQSIMRQQHEDMGLRSKMMMSMRSGLNHGTCIAYWPWKFRERMIDVGPRFTKGVVFDGPNWKHVPIWRFHFPPRTMEIDDMLWASMEYEITREELSGLVENIRLAKAPGTRTRDLNTLDLKGKFTSEGGEVSENIRLNQGYFTSRDNNLLHVDDYWGIHPTMKNPRDPNSKKALPLIWRILIVNGREWIVQMVNPYAHGRLPFGACRFLPNEEDFYGIGMGDILADKYIAINERRNLMTDIVTMALFGMWQRTGGIPGKVTSRVRLFPGKIFNSVIDGVMAQLHVDTSVLRPGMALDSIDIEEMRATSGASSNVQGIKQGGTATEIRNIATESARKIATYAIIFSAEMSKKFLETQAELNEQFLPFEFGVSITGEDGVVRGQLNSKQNLLRRAQFQMKVATDLEFRRPLLRNINQSIQQLAQVVQLNPRLEPVIMPAILQLTKKTLILYGENASQLVNSARIQQILSQPPAARMPVPA
ncbi:hypothetical protein LCGC14_0450890 [marine sediment metagenome]|uniref:Portal protein n=1 Tax=marine sediment metagenome TaxID=412755 RepID=A0A0F9VRR4_9ZZZZ